MTSYLDASVLVTLVAPDAHWPRIEGWARSGPDLALSQWTLTEVSSAWSQRVRMKLMPDAQRSEVEASLEGWLLSRPQAVTPATEDFIEARALLRRHALLRAGDALHLALVKRLGFAMATLDAKLADATRAEGIALVEFDPETTT